MKICKKCEMQKEDYEFKKYSLQCKSCIKEYMKQYKRDNKEKLSEYLKRYTKEYRKNNKNKILENGRIYYKNNKDKICNYTNIYRKEKRKTNLEYKLRLNVSSAINRYLKLNSGSKNGKSCLKYL